MEIIGRYLPCLPHQESNVNLTILVRFIMIPLFSTRYSITSKFDCKLIIHPVVCYVMYAKYYPNITEWADV